MNKEEIKMTIVSIFNLILGFVLVCLEEELLNAVKNIYNFIAIIVTLSFGGVASGYILLLPKQVIKDKNFKKEYDGEIISFSLIFISCIFITLLLAYQEYALKEIVVFYLFFGIILFIEFVSTCLFYEILNKFESYKMKKRIKVATALNEVLSPQELKIKG